ncbi:MAG: hypothetical protein LDL23_12000 [Flavobacterium sp.]|uniref:hypothetical protein n=1 Tax=Flavobacterium sp. TaxID=239 RepID=UPI0025B89AED|nr:hypothetical protein [Flavobacterium sp.]MCA1967353.1 hypothetical protein [Flavobacterium sp.]
MKIKELKNLVDNYIDDYNEFSINRELFDFEDGRKKYNSTIRDNVRKNSFGIYVWVNPKNDEVIYIGMAGKIKSDGTSCDHSLAKRLTATRGKDKETKLDILTNDYVKTIMDLKEIEKLDFYIFYTKTDEPPSYVESILLYNYFKQQKRLPILNNSF